MSFDPGPASSFRACGACCEEQGMPPGHAIPARFTLLPRELPIGGHGRLSGWQRRRVPPWVHREADRHSTSGREG